MGPRAISDGGNEAYQTIVKFIKLRYVLRPYILEQMKTVADNGIQRIARSILTSLTTLTRLQHGMLLIS